MAGAGGNNPMAGMMGGGGADAVASGAAGTFSANDLTEDQYVRVWEEYSKQSGQGVDPMQLRQMYRQHKMSLLAGQG